MIPLPPVPPRRKLDEEEFYELGQYGPRLLVLSLLTRLSGQNAPDPRPAVKKYRRGYPLRQPL